MLDFININKSSYLILLNITTLWKKNKSLENMRNILNGRTHFTFKIYKYTIYIYFCVEKLFIYFLIIKKKESY